MGRALICLDTHTALKGCQVQLVSFPRPRQLEGKALFLLKHQVLAWQDEPVDKGACQHQDRQLSLTPKSHVVDMEI